MADYKNQHFVPRCHFKPFSLNGEGKAINLLAVDALKLIRNAPIKSQCAKSYFYGTDVKLESRLSQIEAFYSKIVDNLRAGSVAETDLENLRELALFQHLRTEAAVENFRRHQSGVADIAFASDPSQMPVMDLSNRALSVRALELWSKISYHIEDLSVALLVNKSPEDFITSNDPCVVLNRFANQKLRTSNFGYSSSGLIVVMPISPRMAVFAWDPNVYRLQGLKSKKIELNSLDDINPINRFQMVKQTSILYFNQWKQGQSLIPLLKESLPFRTDQIRFHVLVPDGSDERGERFRSLKDTEDRRDFEHFMIRSEAIHTKPEYWPSFLKYRVRIKTFNDGSAVGYVRKKKWLDPRERRFRPPNPLEFQMAQNIPKS